MSTLDPEAQLEEQIARWRSYLRRRQALQPVDVTELEDHLRESVAGLRSGGLSAEEAFLRELQVERDSQAFGLWMALNALRMALVHAPRPRTRHASPWLLRVAAEAAERLAA